MAFAVVVLLAQVGFPPVMAVGSRGGGAGVIAALFVAGFALALLFTAIYDGPRSLARLLRKRPRSRLTELGAGSVRVPTRGPFGKEPR